MDSFYIAFVCNFRYLDKFFDTCKTRIDALNKHMFVKNKKQIRVKYFEDIAFSAKIDKTNTLCSKFGYCSPNALASNEFADGL